MQARFYMYNKTTFQIILLQEVMKQDDTLTSMLTLMEDEELLQHLAQKKYSVSGTSLVFKCRKPHLNFVPHFYIIWHPLIPSLEIVGD